MKRKLDDKECYIAQLDMYCDELYRDGELSKGELRDIKNIFKRYPELKKEFPSLTKLLK